MASTKPSSEDDGEARSSRPPRRRASCFNEAVVRRRRRASIKLTLCTERVLPMCFNEAVVRRRRRGAARRGPASRPSRRFNEAVVRRRRRGRFRQCTRRSDPDASTKPSSEDDGERMIMWLTIPCVRPLQRSRRPKTTERGGAGERMGRSTARFNEAVVRRRRRVGFCMYMAHTLWCGFNEAVVRRRRRVVSIANNLQFLRTASTKPSSEDDGEIS